MEEGRDRKRLSRVLCVLLGTVCAAVLLCACAFAYPAIDTAKDTSLLVTAKTPEGAAVEKISFTLYRAADLSIAENQDVAFHVTQAFSGYAENTELLRVLEGTDVEESDWAAAAKTVAPLVQRDEAEGLAFDKQSADTNENGEASFSGLTSGLYLLVGTYGGSAYPGVEVTPVFLTAPQLSRDKAQWLYEASVSAKVAVSDQTEQELTVRKIWLGDDTPERSAQRPAGIEVQLLQNGTVEDTQTLSQENGWSFTWTGLEAGKTYSVAEASVPDGYVVTTQDNDTQQGREIILTNTTAGVFGEYREAGSNPPSTPSKSGVKGSARSGDTASEQSAQKLPQTGQLWWPVWILAAAGALLVVIGLLVRGSGKRDTRESRS